MVSFRRCPAKLFLGLALLNALPTWCQTTVLKGNVSDIVDNKALPGADVIVQQAAGSNPLHVISGPDGHYSVSGLKRGDQVTIQFSFGGYLPHPLSLPVTLVAPSTTQDAQLIHDTDDQAYMTKWAERVKTAVDNSTNDQNQRDRLYDLAWSSLSAYGFSGSAQAQAARQLLTITPSSSHSADLESFASTDIESLRKADADIRAAVTGDHELSNRFNIPSDVAAQIAAGELKDISVDDSWRQKFIQKFESLWGLKGKDELNNKLNTHPQVMSLHDLEARGPGS